MNKFRWLAVALSVSLIVNLLLAGFLGGRFSAGPRHGPMFDPMLALRGPAGFLSSDRIAQLKPLLGQFRSAAPSLRRLRGTQRSVYEAVTAQPFERDRLETTLADFRDNLLSSQQAGHTAFIDLVEALTPDERGQMLKRMRDRLRERHPAGHPPRHQTD